MYIAEGLYLLPSKLIGTFQQKFFNLASRSNIIP